MKDKDTTVGVLIGNICASHTDDILNGIVQRGNDCGVKTMFFMGAHANSFDELYYYEGGNKEQKYIFQFNTVFDYIRMGKLDVIVVLYSTFYLYLQESKEEFFDRFKDLNIPIIIVGDMYKDITCVISDNYDGIGKCIDNLVEEHNCKNIAYIGGPKENNRDAEERLDAYYMSMFKHNLEIKEGYIKYGDYSANSKHLIAQVLDEYDDIDAFVCANDTMALACYEECRKRGKEPGRDIKITGFDDIPEAKSSIPSLTTVEQNAYDLGYMAMKKAIDLYEIGDSEDVRVPVYFKKRNSTEYNSVEVEDDSDILKNKNIEEIKKEVISKIAESIFFYKLCIDDDIKVHKILDDIFTHIFEVFFNKDVIDYDIEYIQMNIKKLVECGNVSIGKFVAKYSKYITKVLFLEEDVNKQKKLMDMTSKTVDYIQSIMIVESNFRIDTLQRHIWTTPFITRDMIVNIDNDVQTYECIMERLRFMQVNNAYMFLLDKKVVNKSSADWKCPERLRLVAKIENGKITPDVSGVFLTKENGFVDIIDYDNCDNMATYTLFAGKRVYGILVCELKKEYITSMYSVSLHIGSAIQFMDLIKQQRQIQGELENVMNVLKSKNEILNVISEKDELTGLYNRRGFFENAMNKIKGERYTYVLCIYADLDHLKDINDKFGHTEGDFSIKKAGEYLKSSLRDSDIIGRIGGDEFAAIAIVRNESDALEIIDRIKANTVQFNDSSDKPYYIDITVGYCVEKCTENTELDNMIRKADSILYERKAYRRSDIRKKA